jgi:hypothetical protein
MRARGALLSMVALALTFAVAGLVVVAPALAAGDTTDASCANEASPGFRAFMPDCRGYELVTPPYKAGQPVGGSNQANLPISPDGKHLLGIAFSGFGNVGNLEESSEFGSPYEFSRGSAGWTVEALAPPASRAARSDFEATSADLSRTLWELSDQAAPGEEIFRAAGYSASIREVNPAGEVEWQKVGPLQPSKLPSDEQGSLAFSGASDDLGHLLFTPANPEELYWPGDATLPGDPSLYEYRGSGNSEPELIGIANPGRLAGVPHINEGAELVSKCGTILGSSNAQASAREPGSVYHAISASGEVVYFSALHSVGCALPQPPATELYARVDAGSAGAHTVAISEPLPSDCAACDDSSPREAVFDGAARDGSRVFFTSEQALLPGASGENLYEFDFLGAAGDRVHLVAANLDGVARLSSDGTHIYFVSSGVLTAAPDQSLPPALRDPVGGKPNLYVYADTSSEYGFIATLAPADAKIWMREDLRPFQTTSDGRFAVFPSAVHLTADDQATTPQLFEYDATGRSLRRVSIGQSGGYACALTGNVEPYGCNGNENGETGPRILAPEFSNTVRPAEETSQLVVDGNGNVVFTSPDALTPGAVNDRILPLTGGATYVENIYEYRDNNVYLISPGDEEAPLQWASGISRLIGMSSSGSDIFFRSTSRLAQQDGDSQQDWYDARAGGGLAPEAGVSQCGESGCQGTSGLAPVLASSGGTEVGSGEAPVATATRPSVRSKPQTRREKLVHALKQCAREHREKRRLACVRHARKLFGEPRQTANAKGRGR